MVFKKFQKISFFLFFFVSKIFDFFLSEIFMVRGMVYWGMKVIMEKPLCYNVFRFIPQLYHTIFFFLAVVLIRSHELHYGRCMLLVCVILWYYIFSFSQIGLPSSLFL